MYLLILTTGIDEERLRSRVYHPEERNVRMFDELLRVE
jgi:hypothetical protein